MSRDAVNYNVQRRADHSLLPKCAIAALTGASVPDEIRRKYADELAAGRILLVISSRSGKDDELIAHTMTDRHDRHLIWQSEMTVLTT